MDIKVADSTLRKFLKTKAAPPKIAEALTLCGPSVDRLTQKGDDPVYEIEVITNRVDSASAFGIAREACAILPLFGFKASLINSPYDIKASQLPPKESPTLPLQVSIQDHSLVKRFSAIILDHLTVKSSPKYIQHELECAGIRSLNNLVDVTNYLTLLYGQPVHIFDYDKIKGAKMVLRESQKKETIITLDNKSHTLKGGDIVIEDGEGRLIDLCGIMGGKLSEVDEDTQRAILFVQTYEPKHIRKTSLYTQERTFAAQIFEKQPDTRLVMPVLIEGVKLLRQLALAKIASDSIDLYYQKPSEKTISLDIKWLSDLIGHDFDVKTVIPILSHLGFTSKKSSPHLVEVSVPSWRLHDITIKEDLAEEIARVYGYFHLEGHLPIMAPLNVTTEPLLDWEYSAKNYLAGLGFNEIFNYSLISSSLFQKAGMEIEGSIQLSNPLTADYEYLRRSLLPSLLSNLENNQGKISPPLRLFELANIYLTTDTELPEEKPILALAVQGEDFRHVKGYLEALLVKLHINHISYKPLKDAPGIWQLNQTCELYSGNIFLGIFGSVKPLVKDNFHLQGEVLAANLDFSELAALANSRPVYTPVSEYPDVVEDITIDSQKSLGSLIQLIKAVDHRIISVIYKTSLGSKHTFALHFNDSKRNLTQTDADNIKSAILKKV